MSKRYPEPCQEPYKPQTVVLMQHVTSLGLLAESCRRGVIEDMESVLSKRHSKGYLKLVFKKRHGNAHFRALVHHP